MACCKMIEWRSVGDSMTDVSVRAIFTSYAVHGVRPGL